MACKVTTPRLSAIYDVILWLHEDPNIKTLKDVKDWFALNRPQISEAEIIESYIVATPKNVKNAANTMEALYKNLQKRKQSLRKLNSLIGEISVLPKGENAPTEKIIQLNETVNKLYYSIEADGTLSQAEKNTLYMMLGDIQINYSDYFTSGDIDAVKAVKYTIESRLKEVLALLGKTKGDLNLVEKSIDKRVDGLKTKIKRLLSDENPVEDLLDPDSGLEYEPINSDILAKEMELSHVRSLFDKFKVERKIKEEAKNGILGFKGDAAVAIREKTMLNINEVWETARSLKFMLDLSAYAVQLAPVVIPDIVSTKINVKALGDIDFSSLSKMISSAANVFPNQKKTAMLIKNQMIDIIVDDLKAIDWKDPNAAKRAQGQMALKALRDIKLHPVYGIARRAHLSIAETRSGILSEEMFRATLLNEIKGFGFLKDASEDAMVTPINHIRFQLFLQFYNAHPTANMEELTKVAEAINEATGTSSINVGKMSYVMSAPKLLMSRLNLAFVRPFKILASLDIPASFQQKGLKFQTSADAFIANQWGRMMAGYSKMFILAAAIGALASKDDDDDFWVSFKKKLGSSFDWEGSDYLRIRANSTHYDFTGGVGAMYRMFFKSLLIAAGPSDEASFLAKNRYKMFKGAQGQTWLTPVMETLVKNRLHPAINSGSSILTGKDFMGKPYHDFFGAGNVASRAEGILRAVMPIYVETCVDQFLFTPRSGVLEDVVITSVQALGVNTFESQGDQSVLAREWFEKNEYKPSVEYPKELSKSTNKESLELDALRDTYRREYADLIGKILEENPNISENSFKSKLKAKSANLKREFLKEHKSEIKKLK